MNSEGVVPALVDELARLSTLLLQASRKRQFDAFVELYTQQEACLQQLHDVLAGTPILRFTTTEHAVLQQVLASRQDAQALVAQWSESLKADLHALNQSSRILKAYCV